MPDERLLFRTRPHPIVLAAWVLLSLSLEVALLSVGVRDALAILGAAIVVAVLVSDYFGTVYEATTKAVSKREGIIWRREERIPLGKIQDLKFSAGFLGLLLGFGRLEIESAGTEGKMILPALPISAYRVLRPLRRRLQRKEAG